MEELVRDGWLVCEHSRGMFVGTHKIDQQVVGGSSSSGAAYAPAQGAWTSRMLSNSIIPAGTSLGSRLRVEAGTPSYASLAN